MRPRHLLLTFLVVLAAAPLAHAQYKWRDANGRMVYSDMPPPASIAPRDVLQSPARPTPANAPTGSGDPAKPGAFEGSNEPVKEASKPGALGAADKELEFRKRRQERMDSEAKQMKAESAARTQQAQCAEARNGLRSLERGMPVSMVNERGEPQLLDESQRKNRIDALRQSLQDSCRSAQGASAS
jgi:hypothetical protein